MSKDSINLSLKIIIQKGYCLYYEKELKAKEIEDLTHSAEKWAMEEISQLNIVKSLKSKYKSINKSFFDISCEKEMI